MSKDLIAIPEWTKEDYLYSEEPFKWLYEFKDNKFKLAQYCARIKDKAGEVGVTNFINLWRSYLVTMRKQNGEEETNTTDFQEQSLELYCGSYICNDYGVAAVDNEGRDIQVCNHPIMPVRRLVNIDTGETKIEIAFRRGERWKTLIVDRFLLSSANKIIELSKYGVSVDSESAKYLVKYFTTIIDINYDCIPELKSIGRLGYIKEYGFSPYVENLVFDGSFEFARLYDAVHKQGIREDWIKTAKECRKMSIASKIILAASFASVMLEPLNLLPFFVHLWGSESGTGKTVALMLAASVWGNPKIGEYVKTFDATDVGNERTAAFLNQLPFCLDELQLIRNNRGQTSFNVYRLAQGVGRTRGKKAGGIDIAATWRNCILSTGESPLTNASSGAGAYNRIMEIECLPSQPVITEGNRISYQLLNNYGFAGKEFVKKLYSKSTDINKMRGRYNEIFNSLLQTNTTEKQAMAAAVVLLADEIITKMFFDNENHLEICEVEGYLADKQTVSVGQRAYQFLCSWVTQNTFKLCGSSENTEVYGKLEGNFACIIRDKFDEILVDAGYSPKAILSYLKCNGLIDTAQKGFTKLKRINKMPIHCVVLRVQEDIEINPFDEMGLL